MFSPLFCSLSYSTVLPQLASTRPMWHWCIHLGYNCIVERMIRSQKINGTFDLLTFVDTWKLSGNVRLVYLQIISLIALLHPSCAYLHRSLLNYKYPIFISQSYFKDISPYKIVFVLNPISVAQSTWNW